MDENYRYNVIACLQNVIQFRMFMVPIYSSM